ncbi:alkaline phosphatase family protein [Desulfosarcina widdelii]|uniref:Alkaline phosphatase family protein n=1 Tax=Desulfosarcina widdelii TaxID=947919 RepID=A0A5K7Z3J5_9BACT|nr:alkaline phosphatase family protein [Desulfosarcina widdelii]BBO74829.1 alkaline phosphatase family protein [Desulfosarcina widdelii]
MAPRPGKALLLFVVSFAPFLLAAATTHSRVNPTRSPKLILQITVDQLRGDMPTSVYDRLGEGGFKYLYENGVVYENAHHRHANTETVVGHATLATGADPADHGMIANIWFDKELGRAVYNIEDDRYALIGEGGGVDKDNEMDPTQKVAGTDGRSPAAILTTTFSDELALRTHGKAKIFGVSVKDRGAVPMAGHAGKAFWFSKAKGEFVTSTYYYDAYPGWVKAWNRKKLALAYADTNWDLIHDRSTYTYGKFDDMPWETNLPGYGVVFPHPFGKADGKLFTSLLTVSPAGDELTLEFAKALMVGEELGQDEIPDYLSISFSSTDYIGHIFGPGSLESEDNLLRLDKTLSELLAFVDQQIGLDNTLIVLSADHGAAEAPAQLNEFGINARIFEADKLDKEKAIETIKAKYGIAEELVSGFEHPYLYLDHDVLRKHKLDVDEVSRTIAAELTTFDGVAYAVPSIDLIEGKMPDTRLYRQILRNFNPKRSGDIYLVLEPQWFVAEFEGLTVASTHGSPWRYDTFVPIIFSGNGLTARTVFREVQTVDIALTLSKYLRIKAPSGATGAPLIEVLSQ